MSMLVLNCKGCSFAIQETMVDGTEELVNGGSAVEDYILQEALAPVATLDELPPPHPPSCKKKELYADASVFDELDEYVFGVSAPSLNFHKFYTLGL